MFHDYWPVYKVRQPTILLYRSCNTFIYTVALCYTCSLIESMMSLGLSMQWLQTCIYISCHVDITGLSCGSTPFILVACSLMLRPVPLHWVVVWRTWSGTLMCFFHHVGWICFEYISGFHWDNVHYASSMVYYASAWWCLPCLYICVFVLLGLLHYFVTAVELSQWLDLLHFVVVWCLLEFCSLVVHDCIFKSG